MGFFKRLIGARESAEAPISGDSEEPADLDALEREHELEVARGEQERLDELQQRQLRYANYAWEPPAQGGERRADDTVESAGE